MEEEDGANLKSGLYAWRFTFYRIFRYRRRYLTVTYFGNSESETRARIHSDYPNACEVTLTKSNGVLIPEYITADHPTNSVYANQ